MSKSASGEASSDTDTPGKELAECPTCGRSDFKSEFGIKKHHKIAHGESITVSLTCEVCGNEYERYPSDVKKGRVCSMECAGEIVSEELSGENHYNWSGGSPSYYGSNWNQQRKATLKRDGYSCRDCGALQPLHVHHKTPIRKYDILENANDLDNLVTLCQPCHKERHR